jgi:hypothetical protein
VFRIITAYGTEEVFDMPQQLLRIGGMGMPSVNTFTVNAPHQHGETVLGFVLRPKLLNVSFHLKNLWGPSWPPAQYGTRQRLLGALNPALGPFTFQIDMSNGDTYQLQDVFYEADFEAGFPGDAGEVRKQRVAVRLRCGDPLWHGESRSVAYDLSAGPVTHDTETFGNFFTWPYITLTGPLLNPTVYLLEWNGADYNTLATIGIQAAILAGQHVYIQTRVGERSIVDDDDDNVALTESTALSNFVFSPRPIREVNELQADPSYYNNIVRITASSYGGSATVAYDDLWTGV